MPPKASSSSPQFLVLVPRYAGTTVSGYDAFVDERSGATATTSISSVQLDATNDTHVAFFNNAVKEKSYWQVSHDGTLTKPHESVANVAAQSIWMSMGATATRVAAEAAAAAVASQDHSISVQWAMDKLTFDGSHDIGALDTFQLKLELYLDGCGWTEQDKIRFVIGQFSGEAIAFWRRMAQTYSDNALDRGHQHALHLLCALDDWHRLVQGARTVAAGQYAPIRILETI
ncbi:hypothetical protein AMAG_20752 [Allomyces macrogynus ATCC 38327]|uniref:Uncharacterized protein n=1 Tax=Allomyces macrogynus (strain ATCC 38327) TaxID=578462 RepID=A0A0L0TF84_ALLM3|nr:hypothetical protein AMAG_20752 [Allomyces macrogynus ATCC 38327]|eukprot:KNE73365.1 hypothetical protein AMAG_20752 [Allomyces macrogynus ATCC 38327]